MFDHVLHAPRPPILSRHPTNPIGETRRIHHAARAIKRRLKIARDIALREFDTLPVTVITNARRYEYEVSPDALEHIAELVWQALQDDGRAVLREEVIAAYRSGTARAAQNLIGLTSDYNRDIARALSVMQYERRAALAAARVFELMDGFRGDTRADLAFLLLRAVQDGQNPRQTARDIRKRFAMQGRRAERIARTEITMAARRGNWDETRDAGERLGLNTYLLHQSALIPGRTRTTHAARHGRIVSIEEQAEWYAVDGNPQNCLCSASAVPLNAEGAPITGGKLIERMRAARRAFLATDRTPRS